MGSVLSGSGSGSGSGRLSVRGVCHVEKGGGVRRWGRMRVS